MRVNNENETKDDIARRMGLSRIMIQDVERIFNDTPDLSDLEFYYIVHGDGDDGYDEECSNAMYDYYNFLQNIIPSR